MPKVRKLNDDDRLVARLLKEHPEKSYSELDRELGKGIGYSRQHANRWQEITGERLFDETDIYGRGGSRKEKGAYTDPETLSDLDIEAAELYMQGLSYRQIEAKLGEYYGYAGYHIRRYERLTKEKLVRGQNAPADTRRSFRHERTAEDEKTIRDMVKAGESIENICKATSMCRPSVWKYIDEVDLRDAYAESRQSRKASIGKELADRAVELRKQGLSFQKIAKSLHISLRRLYGVLEEHTDESDEAQKRLRASIPPEKVPIICLLRGCGDTLDAIARIANVKKSTLSSLLNRQTSETKKWMDRMQEELALGSDAARTAEKLGLSPEDAAIVEERVLEQETGVEHIAPLDLTPEDKEAFQHAYSSMKEPGELKEELGWPIRKVLYACALLRNGRF